VEYVAAGMTPTFFHVQVVQIPEERVKPEVFAVPVIIIFYRLCTKMNVCTKTNVLAQK
jgi:hypothetical protein